MSDFHQRRRARRAQRPPTARLRQVIEKTVALAYELPEASLRSPTRGHQQVARARQTAMYLTRTVCQYTLSQTGEIFDRDRTTVSHACGLIEQRRDDPSFNEGIELLESIVLVLTGPAGVCTPSEDVPVNARPETGA